MISERIKEMVAKFEISFKELAISLNFNDLSRNSFVMKLSDIKTIVVNTRREIQVAVNETCTITRNLSIDVKRECDVLKAQYLEDSRQNILSLYTSFYEVRDLLFRIEGLIGSDMKNGTIHLSKMSSELIFGFKYLCERINLLPNKLKDYSNSEIEITTKFKEAESQRKLAPSLKIKDEKLANVENDRSVLPVLFSGRSRLTAESMTDGDPADVLDSRIVEKTAVSVGAK